MGTLAADVRQALRVLGRSRAFTGTAIALLAVGLAANTAVFSVADAVLFRPLAYEQPQQLVSLAEVIPQFSHLYPRLPVNARHFYEWQQRCRSFSSMAIMQDGAINLTGADGPPERIGMERVSPELLPLLGVRPLLGRNFTADEDRPNNNRVVLLSDHLWQRRFHGDPAILNRKIMLDGVPHVVVGILPPWFRFPRPDLLAPIGGTAFNTIELFKPLGLDRAKLDAVGEFNYTVLGRLRPGTSRDQASSELNTVQAALTKEFGRAANMEGMELRGVVTPLQEQIVGGSRRALLVLLAAIAAVLLIMCVNLGNLMLARATARQREMAVRTALGASSWRIVRQVLTESLAIALAGGALGFALAYAAVRALVAAAPVDLPRLEEVRLDYHALLFAFAASLIAGLLFGLIPAIRSSRSQPQDALRTGGRTFTSGRHALRLSEVLVGAEVALSAMLLVAAGLLVGSFMRILAADQGFHAENVLTASLNLSGAKYTDEKQRVAFLDRLLPAVRNLPGVQAAGLISALPLEGQNWVDMITRDDDHRPVFQRPTANYRFISQGYFSSMAIPVLRGRSFDDADRSREVVIISATTAARIWPGQDPVGKRMHSGDDAQPFWEIVGVAADTRADMVNAPPLMVYRPYWKSRGGMRSVSLTIRTGQDPASASSSVRNAIWSVDADMPVPEMKTMRQIVRNSVSQRRFETMLLAGFALGALLLAAIGIYGVISYSMNRRRNEIGIRMALGAEASQVRRMVLAQGMRPVAAGMAAGIAGALALGRLLQALLFEMKPANPLVIGSVIVVLALAAGLACFAPALRATRVDPSTALRYE